MQEIQHTVFQNICRHSGMFYVQFMLEKLCKMIVYPVEYINMYKLMLL